ITDLGRPADDAARPERPLTARELDALAHVALGCTNAEVAQRLSISAETVKAYLRSAGQKLGTRTRFEAVTRARSLGLLP
ncbi:response regulator transcription factor, partial [Mycobacterium kansasii]